MADSSEFGWFSGVDSSSFASCEGFVRDKEGESQVCYICFRLDDSWVFASFSGGACSRLFLTLRWQPLGSRNSVYYL